MIRFAVVCFSVLCLWAPSVVAAQEFEVASLRPADPAAQVTVGVHVDGSQVRISGMSLKHYAMMAYGMKPHQVIGPDWLGTAYFELAAKVPEGVPATKVPEMLRALLATRFGMTSHRESKEFSVLAIVVAKGGLKIRPSAPASGDDASGAVTVNATGGAAGSSADLGNGAAFQLANNKLSAQKLTLPVLAELLTRVSERPVIDATGLADRYDLDIEIAPEDFTSVMVRGGVNNGMALPGAALRLLDGANPAPFTNGMQRLGLDLESRKAPLDVLVIDTIRKTPTEN